MKKEIEMLMDYNTGMSNDARLIVAEKMAEMAVVIEAVAHIGVDWGYGKYTMLPTDAMVGKAKSLLDT